MDAFFRNDLLIRLRTGLFASPLYHWLLQKASASASGPAAVETAIGGNQQRGQSLRLAELAQAARQAPSARVTDTDAFARFFWLRDLQASRLETSVSVAQEITEAWIEANGDWHAASRELDVLADRLSNWLAASTFVLAGAAPDFAHLFAKTLACQARHMSLAVRLGEPVPPGFGVAKAMILCGLALDGLRSARQRGVDQLRIAIDHEIRPDGTHRSRNPYLQTMALGNLIDVRSALRHRTGHVPDWLQSAIERVTPALRTFVMGDGQLTNVNGAGPVAADDVAALLKQSQVAGRALAKAPDGGFQRLVARRTIVVMDSAEPHRPDADLAGNAGALAFEMSVGKQRLIVNCGWPGASRPEVLKALRGTAAHSTLSIDDTNSSELTDHGNFGPRRAWQSQIRRREIEKNTLVEAGHDGYMAIFGLEHKRSLYLSSEGTELRGEDVVRGPGEHLLTLRFHLHPSVQASMVESGASVLLKFGKSAGWRFRTSAQEMALTPSIYFEAGTQRQCRQIVLTVPHGPPETIVKWRLAMET